MKTNFKYTILGILIASFFFPILSTTATIAPAQAEVRRFRIGTTTSPSSNWDIPVAPVGTTITTMFMPVCLETLVGLPDKYDRGLSEGVYKSDTYVGVLATDWTNDFWPEEMNSKGFVNQGGVANMTLRLREGVKFHDGSDWNATVAKWNIDRVYIISGNLTGRGDLRFKDTFWLKANDWLPYYTESWNMTSYGGAGVYGYYDTGPTHGIVSNPNPFGGYTTGGARIDYAPYQRYPTVKRVVITDDQQSGGEIRVEFNDFNTAGMTGLGLVGFISMQAYADYWDTGIYGFDNEDPKDMIGTGPYIYEQFDDATGGGSLIKNYNYWNRTALEADGWFDADYIDIVTFPPNDAGVLSRNTAFMAHSLDFALDSHWTPIDIEDVMAEPRINYIERPVVDQVSMLMLNCINETWWVWPTVAPYVESIYPTPTYPASNTPNGMPRALRKAVSYCFDYDTYINVGLDGRAVRAASIGVNNLYYNPSIPIATYDVTIARNALLTDPYFAPKCAANGLDINSTDIEWQNVANGVGGKTPLWYLDFYWDNEYQVFKNLYQLNLADIGVALKDPTGATNKVPLTMWDEIQSYWVNPCFPVFSAHGWPLDVNFPSKTPEGVTQFYFSDPNQGSWRPPTYTITDWFPWWNLAFAFNSSVDGWIKRLWLSNDTSRQEWFDKIADYAQNYEYPHLYICQHKQGSVVWRDWEISTYWASISYHLTRYVGFGGEEFPEIPGFLTGTLMAISILTMVGIIYAVQRKIRFK
jgi:ABC-type transport system substrate-binding protein